MVTRMRRYEWCSSSSRSAMVGSVAIRMLTPFSYPTAVTIDCRDEWIRASAGRLAPSVTLHARSDRWPAASTCAFVWLRILSYDVNEKCAEPCCLLLMFCFRVAAVELSHAVPTARRQASRTLASRDPSRRMKVRCLPDCWLARFWLVCASLQCNLDSHRTMRAAAAQHLSFSCCICLHDCSCLFVCVCVCMLQLHRSSLVATGTQRDKRA